MGATFEVVEFDGNLSSNELKGKYHRLVEEQRYEYGNGGYSGTFATLAGITIQSQTFASRKEAEDYIEKVHQKRDAAIAVKFKDIKKEISKRPTVSGLPIACGNTWSSGEASPMEVRYYYPDDKHSDDRPYMYQTKTLATIYNRESGQREVLFADQLNDTNKEKIKTVWNAYFNAGNAWKDLNNKMEVLVRKLSKVEEDFTAEDWKELKTVRKSLKKALELREKTKAKFISVDTRLGERLYKSVEKDNGIKWLVGGWCAS